MPAIQLTNLGKRYLLEYRDKPSLKESFLNLCRGTHGQQREFWALKDINLEVPNGQMLGIIGKNGSGKTTLLKLLCRVTKPTKGSVKVNGRVAGLLELGTGFQGDLNGRENVYLNGLILGLSKKEVQRNIDAIIAFADIGDFIDAPVRTYSTGMYLRLGFAITVFLNTDILLIDEVLSVGDEAFQEKCLSKITEFKIKGGTIIFVSHNLSMIKRFCERVILLDKGSVIFDGEADMAINRYMHLIGKKGIVRPTKEMEITRVYFKNDKDEILNTFKTEEGMRIIIEYLAHKKIENPVFGIGIHSGDSYISGPNTRDDDCHIDYVEGKGAIEYKINNIPFAEGEYEVSVSAHNVEETSCYDIRFRSFKLMVISGGKKIKYGLIGINGNWSLPK